MKIISRRALGMLTVCLFGITLARGQATTAQKPLMAEDVFKNVQVLKGIPVNEFMETMGFFAASLGYNCTNCHVQESLQNWAKFADDVPAKRMARIMIQMVNTINKANFGGRKAVTCYSCHRGAGHPKVIPSLAEQYGTPPPEDPDEIEIAPQGLATTPPDQVLDKYIQALGGAEKLSKITSFTAKGTYGGWDTDFVKVPIDIYAKSPDLRSSVIHMKIGDSTTTFNGQSAWIAAPDKPVHLLEFPAGQDFDGVKLDADLSFPGQIKQALMRWRAGFPETSINDHDVDVIQGMTEARSRVKLFFDKQTGLLARIVRYVTTTVGTIPIQIDYSDYRDVAGVKMPYHIVATWTDGQSTTELSEIQTNVPVDAAKFAKPAPAVPRVVTPEIP
jgi:photosynthetic reaction center cytochrome c subunit